jgi:hypothetical protein
MENSKEKVNLNKRGRSDFDFLGTTINPEFGTVSQYIKDIQSATDRYNAHIQVRGRCCEYERLCSLDMSLVLRNAFCFSAAEQDVVRSRSV